jgi:hypothetical protein
MHASNSVEDIAADNASDKLFILSSTELLFSPLEPWVEDPEFLRIIFTGEIFKVSLIFSENVLKKRMQL